MRIRFFFLVAVSTSLTGQRLQISPSTAARGDTSSFLIRLESPDTTRPVSVQWDLSVSKQIAITLGDIVLGSSAGSAEKAIVCAVPKRDRKVFRCIVSGGAKTIGNGPIAIVKYTVLQNARKGNVPVRIGKAMGVSGDLRKIDFPTTEGAITVR